MPQSVVGYSQRLKFAYSTGSLVVLGMSLVWGAVFLFMDWLLLAGTQLVLAFVGLASWMLVRRDYMTAALLLSEVAFLAFAVMFCLIFDVPSAAAPRVSHLFLLVLAMLGYVNYLREGTNLQLVIIALCLAGFIAFSSGEFAYSFAHPIPDAFRVGGAWINAIVATGMLCWAIYVMQLEFARTSGMVRALRQALGEGQFELFYQPQVDRFGAVIGAEALLRWKHPQKGYVPPGAFIPLAEQSDLMPRIGVWVIESACRTLSAWRDTASTGGLSVSVNVSADQFRQADFVESVLSALARHGVEPARLTLELTESVLVADVDEVIAKMNVLREAGVTIALDDFGTGYSSLSYLRRLPFDQLKIDQSFVRASMESERGASLLKGIVQMGGDLDLAVVAEGVETREQFAFLKACGCGEFQGYHFGPPMPLTEFEAHLAAQKGPSLVAASA